MSNYTFRRLRPILQLLPHGMRSDRHRVLPSALTTGQTKSTPLDRSSAVIYCVVCIQAGRATEATYQTSDLLCGCDEHIQRLERHGLAAIREARLRAGFESVRGSFH